MTYYEWFQKWELTRKLDGITLGKAFIDDFDVFAYDKTLYSLTDFDAGLVIFKYLVNSCYWPNVPFTGRFD